MSNATLTVRNLHKGFGARALFEGVGFVVDGSSRIGVVGPNGCGKSTLLRVLAGLETLDDGGVVLSPPRATVGYLPQEPERHAGETMMQLLARRTGVAAAEAALERTATALGEGAPGADEAYSAALDRYLSLGGPDLDARAAATCAELGLSDALLHADMTVLSGGQAARASLASILLARFDVFLLDEPTNDLDFDGLERLERFVESVPGGLCVVSHDRAFLERIITSVIEVDEVRHTAREFRGGWKAFLEMRDVARRHEKESWEKFDTTRSQLEERARMQRQWAAEGVKKIKKKASDHDTAQRGFFVNRTEKLASKVRITERLVERLETVDKPWQRWELRLDFATAPRSGELVARLDGATLVRGGFRLGPVSIELNWADRVALVGPNGCGKTTLLGALLGRLPLAAGTRAMGSGVVVGELDQARARFAEARPLVEVFIGASNLTAAEARTLLAKFGLVAEHVTRPAVSLSPGERTRAELALLRAGGVNGLVLDEPTNHLDLPAVEQLERALESWSGTLLLVTHDRRLMEAVRLTRTIDVGAIASTRGEVTGR